jgi:serine/threonine-protein kinase
VKLGDYELDDLLGRGACGAVYRARSSRGDTVAIKVLLGRHKDALPRFERERKLLAELGRDAGFVTLLGAQDSPHGPFLVMELVPGGTLRQRLEERGPMTIHQTLELGRTLALALGRAHARGIVHRDLKPENVLYTKEGRPLIADLGLAKHFVPDGAQSLSKTGELRGTAGYMAPEQMTDAKSAGPASDVFALGAILYECLAGAPPFEGADVITIVTNASAGRFIPLARRRGDVPRWLSATIEKALATDPGDRFPDGVTLARAFQPRASRARSRLAAGVALAACAAIPTLLLARRDAPKTPPPLPAASAPYQGEGPVRLLRSVGRSERKLGSPVVNAAASRDGKLLAAAIDGAVALIDVDADRELWRIDLDATCLALDRAHERVLAGSKGSLFVLDLSSGGPVFALVHGGRVLSLALSPDGLRAITGGEDGNERLWDLEKRIEIASQKHRSAVAAVAFSPDGRSTASIDGGLLRVEGPNSFVRETDDTFRAVAFSPDGRAVVAGGKLGTLRSWDVETGAERARIDAVNGELTQIAYARDGRAILGSSTGEVVRPEEGHLVQLGMRRSPISAFTGDGDRLFVARLDGTIDMFDAVNGTESSRLLGNHGSVNAVAFSPDGLTVLSGGSDGSLYRTSEAAEAARWDVQSMRPIVALASDEGRIFAGREGGLVTVFENNDDSSFRAGEETTGVVGLAPLRDGTLAGANRDGTVWLRRGEETIATKKLGDTLGSLALGGDERAFLVGGVKGAHFLEMTLADAGFLVTPGALRVALARDGSAGWSASTDGEITRYEMATSVSAQFARSPGPIGALAATSGWVAWGTGDGFLEVHDLAHHVLAARIDLARPHDRVTSLAFSRDGKHLAAGTQRGVLLIYAVE